MDLVLIKAFNNKPWRGPKTYQKIETALKAENRNQLESELKNYSGEKDVFVFNIAEYTNEEKSSFIPEILEKLNLKHLGSSSKTINDGLDKAKSKKLFSKAGILTPDSILVEEINQSCFQQAEKMPLCHGILRVPLPRLELIDTTLAN